MKQRYNELSLALCEQAVATFCDGKWLRSDVLLAIEEYAGIDRAEIRADWEAQSYNVRNLAITGLAMELWERMERLMAGDPEALALEPVVVRPRRDKSSGKLRDICRLGVWHQMFEHLAKLGLDPLFDAKLLPQQYASIPGRGQTAMADKLRRVIRSKRLGIRRAEKTDVHHAYGTTMYCVIIGVLQKEIPSAAWILRLMEALGRAAPGGHLIIGGYLDAWLFNLLMSYALRYVMGLGRQRRGDFRRLVTASSAYMDDFGLLGSRAASLRSAVTKLARWLRERFGLELKPERHVVRFLRPEEERALRGQRRNPPGLDMGGYVVHKTYVSIRRTVFVRVRRQFLRAAEELRRWGTVRIDRARSLTAYKGYFDRTDSRGARLRLMVDKLMAIAKRVVGAHGRWDANNTRRVLC